MRYQGRAHRFTLSIAGAVGTALLLASCSAAPTTSPSPTGGSEGTPGGGDPVTVAFVPKVIHPWYDDVEAGAKKFIEEAAGTGREVSYTWFAPQHADVTEWTQQVQNAIQSHPDVLAISCLDPDAGVSLIADATTAGIKVINFDTPCSESQAISFVGHYDATQDGYDMGKLLAEKLGGNGEVAVLAGSPGAVNHEQRVTGFNKALEEFPDMKIVATQFDNDDLQQALQITASLLQANPNLAGVFGANASAPVGAGQAVQEAQRTGKTFVTGMDDLPEALDLLREGVILGLSVQNVQDIGYYTMQIGTQAIDGQEVPELKETGSKVVTLENVDNYKTS